MRSQHRSPSINKRLIPIVIFVVLVLAVTGTIIGILSSGILYRRVPVHTTNVPLPEGIEEILVQSPLDAGDMLDRTRILMSENRDTAPFVVSWYLLPGNIASQKESMSEYLLVQDQILLLRAFIACDRKDDATVLQAAIDTTFRGEDGFLVDFLRTADIVEDDTAIGSEPTDSQQEIYRTASVTTASGDVSSESSVTGDSSTTTVIPESSSSYSDTLSYVGALLLYYDKWGTSSDMDRIKKYADALYSENLENLAGLRMPAPTPTPIPAQFLLDNPELAAVTPAVEEYSFIPLSSLDLASLQMLASIDSRFTPLLEKAAEILASSRISEAIPLPAEGYDPQTGGYLYISDRTSSIRLDRSVLALFYLSETTDLPGDMSSWLKQQLLNQRILFTQYDVITGNATSESVAMDAYPLSFSIGLTQGDPALCEAALTPMEQALATNSSSKAKGMLFRTVLTSRVAVYARENLLAVIALSKIPETR